MVSIEKCKLACQLLAASRVNNAIHLVTDASENNRPMLKLSKPFTVFTVLPFVALICISLWSATSKAEALKSTNPELTQKASLVRLAVVNAPVDTGLLAELLSEFERESGYRVEVHKGSDAYHQARNGRADIVISHFGKSELQAFVQEGLGQWPVMLFSNQAVIIGPASDPAQIRDMTDAAAAVAKIANSDAKMLRNPIHGLDYLSDILRARAGQVDSGDWFVDTGKVIKASAIELAEQRQAYVLWGASPFLKWQKKSSSTMEILVSKDPLLQRLMAAVLVNATAQHSVNREGAKALLDFLLKPTTQARIADYRMTGVEQQLWWPAGRDN
jgi:tungstate transport system substrate-binding protein